MHIGAAERNSPSSIQAELEASWANGDVVWLAEDALVSKRFALVGGGRPEK